MVNDEDTERWLVQDAALPPDVRKGFAFPLRQLEAMRGFASNLIEGRSPNEQKDHCRKG